MKLLTYVSAAPILTAARNSKQSSSPFFFRYLPTALQSLLLYYFFIFLLPDIDILTHVIYTYFWTVQGAGRNDAGISGILSCLFIGTVHQILLNLLSTPRCYRQISPARPQNGAVTVFLAPVLTKRKRSKNNRYGKYTRYIQKKETNKIIQE